MLNRTCDELVMNFQRKPSDCPTGAVLSGNFVETKSNVLSLTLEGHTVTRSHGHSLEWSHGQSPEWSTEIVPPIMSHPKPPPLRVFFCSTRFGVAQAPAPWIYHGFFDLTTQPGDF